MGDVDPRRPRLLRLPARRSASITHLTTPLVYALLALSAAAGWQVALALGIGFGLGRSLLAVAGAVLVDRGGDPGRDLDPDHHAGCGGSVGGRRGRARGCRGRDCRGLSADPDALPGGEYRSPEGCGHPSLRARCGCAPPFPAARVDCPCPRSARPRRCRRRERRAVRVRHPPECVVPPRGIMSTPIVLDHEGLIDVHRDQSAAASPPTVTFQARRHQLAPPRRSRVFQAAASDQSQTCTFLPWTLPVTCTRQLASGRDAGRITLMANSAYLARHARPGRVDPHRERGRRPGRRPSGWRRRSRPSARSSGTPGNDVICESRRADPRAATAETTCSFAQGDRHGGVRRCR